MTIVKAIKLPSHLALTTSAPRETGATFLTEINISILDSRRDRLSTDVSFSQLTGRGSDVQGVRASELHVVCREGWELLGKWNDACELGVHTTTGADTQIQTSGPFVDHRCN